MRISIVGLMRLKPFDESADADRAGAMYANDRFMALGVIVSFVFAVIALVLTITASRFAWPALAIGVGVSAVTARLEWNAGLRARSLNQLFATVLATALICLLATTGAP